MAKTTNKYWINAQVMTDRCPICGGDCDVDCRVVSTVTWAPYGRRI